MKEFDHVGIVTTEPQPGESWVELSKVWVTNPRLHPQRIEHIRPFEVPPRHLPALVPQAPFVLPPQPH
jgi:hypothetical protein